MTSRVSLRIWRTALFAGMAVVGMGTTAPATATNYIVDGGFEQPAVATPDEYQAGSVDYAVGQSFGGPSDNAWTVVGSGSTVSITSNTQYTGSSSNPTYYNAHSGDQWIDLTGSADNGSRVGISQTVATTAGTSYSLSFWVGSFVDSATAVELDVNGTYVGTFANPTTGTSPGQGNNYANFIVPVTAFGDSTTFSFYYAAGRSVAALDDVSLTSTIAAAVPEPANWAMMVIGFGAVGAGLRHRRREGERALA